MKRFKKIILVIILVLLLCIIFASNYFYDIAMSKKAFKTDIAKQEHSTVKRDYKTDYFNENNKEVNIKSSTGVELTGYEFIKGNNLPYYNSRAWIYE